MIGTTSARVQQGRRGGEGEGRDRQEDPDGPVSAGDQLRMIARCGESDFSARGLMGLGLPAAATSSLPSRSRRAFGRRLPPPPDVQLIPSVPAHEPFDPTRTAAGPRIGRGRRDVPKRSLMDYGSYTSLQAAIGVPPIRQRPLSCSASPACERSLIERPDPSGRSSGISIRSIVPPIRRRGPLRAQGPCAETLGERFEPASGQRPQPSIHVRSRSRCAPAFIEKTGNHRRDQGGRLGPYPSQGPSSASPTGVRASAESDQPPCPVRPSGNRPCSFRTSSVKSALCRHGGGTRRSRLRSDSGPVTTFGSNQGASSDGRGHGRISPPSMRRKYPTPPISPIKKAARRAVGITAHLGSPFGRDGSNR